MLKVALLSGWHVHAKDYLKQASEIGSIQLTSVWDEDTERGSLLAKDFNLPFEPNLSNILNNKDIDAVIITSPTSAHKDLMVQAANNGKHIFTEKILALTVEDCKAIEEAVRKNNVQFCISYPHRTFPQNLFAKKVVEEKIIGDITLLRIRNAHNGSIANWLPERFYNESEAGGGAMIDLGAHPMYLILYLLGRPSYITSVFTQYAHKGIDDNDVSVMEYENGCIAISETGFVSERSPFSLELYGTKGTLFFGGPEKTVKYITTKEDPNSSDWITPSILPDKLPSAMQQWVDAINGKGEIIFNIKEATALTEIMVKAYESHKLGKKIKL